MSWLARLVLIAVAFSTLPAAAQAATPFTAGAGAEPSVAVGADGSGHVVWMATGANDQVGYCRVSAGAEACNRTELLGFPGATAANDTGRARVFTPAPNKVVIVAGCWNCPGTGIDAVNKTFRWVSNDNGATFPGGAVQIGIEFATNGFGTWLDDLEGGAFVGVNTSQVKAAKALPAEGTAVPYAPVDYAYGPEVARVPGTSKLVAATNNLDVVQHGVYNGPATVLGINTNANWTKNVALPAPEADNSETALSSGPNGVYLTYKSTVPGGARLGLRRFDAAGNVFGPPTYLEGSDPIDANALDQPDSFQDASGRIHVVWRSLYGGGRLRYRVSDTAGSGFSAAANLAQGESFTQPELAAGADGKGFATWTPGTSGTIRVVPLDPQIDPASPGAGAGAGPGISGTSIGDRTLFPGQRTTFRFRSTEAGVAVLTFEKRVKGTKVKVKRKGKKAKTTCRAATRKRLRALRKRAGSPRAYRKLVRKRACKRWARIGRIRQSVQAGVNTIPFNGRIAGRKLTKGQYRGRLVITNAAGVASRTETIRFKVVAKKKPKRRTGGR